MLKVIGIIFPMVGILLFLFSIFLLPVYEEVGLTVIIGLAIIGFISIRIGEFINFKINRSNRSEKRKIGFKRILIRIALSLVLLIYSFWSLSFMGQGDGLTACGVILYIPSYCVLDIYYLYLIWSKIKVSGDKLLLLPLLQKIRLFKAYKDCKAEKVKLAETILPFIVSFFLCPMLTSILYFNVYYHNYRQQQWLIIILLLPLLILVFSLIRIGVQIWISQSNTNEL